MRELRLREVKSFARCRTAPELGLSDVCIVSLPGHFGPFLCAAVKERGVHRVSILDWCSELGVLESLRRGSGFESYFFCGLCDLVRHSTSLKLVNSSIKCGMTALP